MGLFDSHSHLNDEKFDEDREEQIKKICESGVSNFITAGYSVESSKKALEIAKKYDFIYTTAGVSPNDIPQTEEELWKQLAEIEKIVEKNKEKICAIGEIGLDYYWNTDNKELQKKAFIEQIKIANIVIIIFGEKVKKIIHQMIYYLVLAAQHGNMMKFLKSIIYISLVRNRQI